MQNLFLNKNEEVTAQDTKLFASLDDIMFHICISTNSITGTIKVQEGVFEYVPIKNEWGDEDWEWVKLN